MPTCRDVGHAYSIFLRMYTAACGFALMGIAVFVIISSIEIAASVESDDCATGEGNAGDHVRVGARVLRPPVAVVQIGRRLDAEVLRAGDRKDRPKEQQGGHKEDRGPPTSANLSGGGEV